MRAALSFKLLRPQIPLFLLYSCISNPIYLTFKIHQGFSFSTSLTLTWYSITSHLDFHRSLLLLHFLLRQLHSKVMESLLTPESALVTHLFKGYSCYSEWSKLTSILLPVSSLISPLTIPCLASALQLHLASLIYLRNIRHTSPSRSLN